MTTGLVCPACIIDAVSVIGRIDRYDVFRCAACGCTYRSALLGHHERDTYRGRWYHFKRPEERGELAFDQRYDADYDVACQRLDAIAERGTVGGKLLDVGCANGAFVAAALDRGYDAFGVDPNAEIVQWSMWKREDLRGRIEITDDAMRNGDRYDVITCHDVLEHLVDPFAMVRMAARSLVRRGLLVVETPDPACEQAKRDGIRWRHIKPREHPVLLPRERWSEMLEAAGMETVAVREPVPEKIAIYARRRE